jgi:hypothetical protein
MASWLTDFITSGTAIDWVLAFMVLEGLLLACFHRRGVPRRRLPEIGGLLLPGVFLVLALRASLVGSGPIAIVVLLLAALAAHVAELARRGWLTQRR